jgi:hypothetical protein
MRLRPAALSRTLRPPSGISLETHTTGCKGLIMFRTALIVPLLSLICSPAPAAGQASASSSSPLTVVSAGPSGEVASLAEANEVRVVFSEPMVTLGRIPSPVRAPFFRIAPSVPGTFRWSGTTILIFTPDPKKPLPFATRYDVTIDSSAVAVSGRRLEQPHTFSFTTPTVKLLQTHWYRRDGRAGAQMVILLRFNQRVRPTDLLSHVTAAFERHDWAPPVLPASTEAQLRQMDPQAPAAFNAKVAATRAIAESNAPVSIRLTNDWDKKKFPPALRCWPSKRRRLFLRRATCACGSTSGAVARRPRRARFRSAVHDRGREGVLHRRVPLLDECDPDGWNPVRMRSDVKVAEFAKAVKALDLTAAPARPVTKAATPRARPDYERDEGKDLTLEDAGFNAQPPSRTCGHD